MAQAPRIFALNFQDGSISSSASTYNAYTFRAFTAGDIDAFQIYLVQNGNAATGLLQAISTTGLTLKVALGLRAAGTSTVYTSVTLTPAAGGAYFSGTLPLNVAGITGLFAASGADVTADLEFELTDSGNPQTILTSTTIRQQIIPTALQDTPLPDTAIGTQAANATFLKKVNTDAANPFQMIVNDSDGSNRQYVITVQGGVLRCDPTGN